jgi:hypothetical protein
MNEKRFESLEREIEKLNEKIREVEKNYLEKITELKDKIFGNYNFVKGGWCIGTPVKGAIQKLEEYLGIEWKEEKKEGYAKIKKTN